MTGVEPFIAQEIPEPEVAEKKEVKTAVGNQHSLVLWNDDHNTFDHVINCLVKYLKKTVAEAEEIAHIVDSKGKCVILEGNKTDLVEYYNILKLEGLTVTIE